MKLFKKFIIGLFFIFNCCKFIFCEYIPIPFIIHIHSVYSDEGVLSLQQITELARNKGIKVIIFNDHDIMKIEYGLFPLRNIIKKSVDRNSILKIGPEKYLNEINRLNKKYNDIIVIPGVESTPFYYWTGNTFKKNLTLNNWHKHLLIAGLYQPAQYYLLPVVGNEKNAGKFNLFLLWPVLILLISVLLFRINKTFSIIFFIFGFMFIINNFPFKVLPYNQYHGNQYDEPYQYLINYVNKIAPETGMIFWAHPESPNFEKPVKINSINLSTPKYPNSLYATFNYTGFAYFQEGNRIVGSSGGIWDKILVDYCERKRNFPVWAIAELDYKEEGRLGTYIDSFKNIIFMEKNQEFTAGNVIKCIKSGRFYLLKKGQNNYEPILEKFEIKDNKLTATMGNKIYIQNDYNLIINLRTSDNKEHFARIKIIKNGKIIKDYDTSIPKEITEKYNLDDKKIYYRIQIESDNNTELVTNPIFVECKE